MEEPSIKYILLHDRFGHSVENNMLSLGLTMKSTRMQVLRGEILEGVPEAEQPTDSTRIAVVGIERKSLRLECRTEYMARLSEEESNLLLALTSAERRYLTYLDRKRLEFGRQLLPGSAVFVEVKGVSKVLPGVVRYKGVLPPSLGTWFGVELIRHPGSGICDGTFRNKRYFTCPPDSGVFVGLDKLTPRDDKDDLESKSIQQSLMDSILSFWKGKQSQRSSQGINRVLQIDERVVIIIEGSPARGTVRYIGKEGDSTGNDDTIVGLELDERVGSGTGKRLGSPKFICKRDYAAFVPLKDVIPEKDFDGNPGKAAKQEAQGKREQIHEDEMHTRSMSCVNVLSGASTESVRKLRRTNSMTLDKTELIMAAGESSKTDPQEFIEKQRQMLREFECKNVPDNQGKDVIIHDEERTDSAEDFYFEDAHFKNTPQVGFGQTWKRTVHHGLASSDPENSRRKTLGKQRQSRDMGSQPPSTQEKPRENDEEEKSLLERLREMEQQVTQLQAQLEEKESEKQKQGDGLQRQLREMEQRLADEHERQQEKHDQLVNSEAQVREATQQLTNIQEQLQGKDEEIAGLKKQVIELEMSLLTTQQLALNARQRQESPDWVISRNQIQVTDKCLGRGGWGIVVEGKYCGCAVAVKQIHDLILSNHNRSLFVREMNIASRCRHPCLLQFIGATNDEGSPLFVTELMETSLRALLKRPLSATELFVISLDVARALNYLHERQPSPIIHRDISSANVLLWRQGDQWRAKVSDYGTANFMQHTMTVAPGAPIYSAPEAVTKNQTVKVDVYSFGVLLCEMSIQEMPDPKKREQQVALVTNRVIRALIRGCLQTEPGERPCMEEIIDELKQPA